MRVCAHMRGVKGLKDKNNNAKKGDTHNAWDVVVGDANDSAKRCGN